MSLIDKLRKALDADRRIRELEAASERLILENTELSEDKERLETRVANLEAALDRLVKLSGPIVCGGDEVSIFRACRAVLEDESWRR